MSFLIKLLPYPLLENLYKNLGISFADASSYASLHILCLGVIDIEKTHKTFLIFQEEYSRRGYRTVMPNAFLQDTKTLEQLLGQKRNSGEEPILYATKQKNS